MTLTIVWNGLHSHSLMGINLKLWRTNDDDHGTKNPLVDGLAGFYLIIFDLTMPQRRPLYQRQIPFRTSQ